MSEDDRLKKQMELRQAWYERQRAEPSPTSAPPTTEAPLDLKTKRPHVQPQQTTNYDENKRIRILEDRIIQNVPTTYVPPNVYIENNYYEPISPPDSNITDSSDRQLVHPNTTANTKNEATNTVQEGMTEEQNQEFHVVTHDQFLEYMTLKKQFDSTEYTQEISDSENESIDIQSNIPSSREKHIQELIGMSDEYKKLILSVRDRIDTSDISRNILILSLLAKFRMIQRQKLLELIQKMSEQHDNITASVIPEEEDVHIVNEEVNLIPANAPDSEQNSLANEVDEWPSRLMQVPYESQEPQKNLQNAQTVQTNHRYTIIPSGQNEIPPHTYRQQTLPSTFVPNAQRPGNLVSHSDRQDVYSNTDVPINPQQKWDNPSLAVVRDRTYVENVIPSSQEQTYLENETSPIILIQQQKIHSPEVLGGHLCVEQNISDGRISHPEQFFLNNPQPTQPNSDNYSELVVSNYPPQRCNEPVMQSNQLQRYPEGIIRSERVSRRSRLQKQSYEQPNSSKRQIHFDVASQNIEQIRRPDPYLANEKHPEETERSQQQRSRGHVPSKSQQRYPAQVNPTVKQYHDPGVLSSQPVRHPIPPASIAQHPIHHDSGALNSQLYRYPIPSGKIDQHLTHHEAGVLYSQPYRHPIPPTPIAQQRTHCDPSAVNNSHFTHSIPPVPIAQNRTHYDLNDVNSLPFKYPIPPAPSTQHRIHHPGALNSPPYKHPLPPAPTAEHRSHHNPDFANGPPYYRDPILPAPIAHPRHDPGVLNCPPHRPPVPSSPLAQQAYYESTESAKQKPQPKRQYHRRKDTSQKQNPASLRWQRIHSSPIQPHATYAVPPQTIRQTAQPSMAPEAPSQTINPIPEPDYCRPHYTQNENPHEYRHPTDFHPYTS